MLKDLLNEIEQVINNMEHQQKDKDNFYRYIDGLVIKMITEKLNDNNTVYQINNFKGTDSERSVNIFYSKPNEEEYFWEWSKNKPSINVWYKIKLTSIEVKSSWHNYKQYNLKNFSFVTEYDNYEYNLEDKFKEIDEANNKYLNDKKEKLNKSKEEFVNFLESLKQAIINNEDIDETRKELYYEWSSPNGIDKTKSQFQTYLKNYDELFKMNKSKQD